MRVQVANLLYRVRQILDELLVWVLFTFSYAVRASQDILQCCSALPLACLPALPSGTWHIFWNERGRDREVAMNLATAYCTYR